MSVSLGPLFAHPLHPLAWIRPKNSLDYRVTNTFDGLDLLNGGQHRATDVGNFRTGDPVYAPVTTRLARGLKHTDGALGVEFVLGNAVTLELWHLNRVDIAPTWTEVTKGQQVGLTGNTGARLADGSPMPAHTHIALKRDGMPFDVEPHLVMPERPAAPIALEDPPMQIPAGLRPLARAVVGPGNRLRATPTSTEGSRIIGGDIGEGKAYVVQVYGLGAAGEPYTLGGMPGSAYAWVGVFGSTWFVAEPLLTDLQPVGAWAPPADCTAQDNKIAAARTAVAGAVQAVAAAERSLA